MQSAEFQQRLAGTDTLVRRWVPGRRPRAVLQVIHGMAEHSARYARLASSLTDNDIAVYAHDLPGHGPRAQVQGHFADRGGWGAAIDSIHAARELAQREQPGVPVFMLGHSMGSFLLQHYVADRGAGVSGAVLSATTGEFGALRSLGLLLVRIEAAIRGIRAPSAVGHAISFSTYNRKFLPARTDFDWLSRDAAEVSKYVADPLCGFRCSTGLWIDLLGAAGALTHPRRLARIPANLPVLMIAGGDDPVAGGGSGLRALEHEYLKAGLGDVTVKTWPGARHELFNETCRDEVTAYLLEWLGNHLRDRGS